MSNQNNQNEGKNNNISPDYQQLLAERSNGAVLDNFTNKILAKGTSLTKEEIAKLVAQFGLVIVMKFVLENTKKCVDSINITDFTCVKHAMQRLTNTTMTYDIIKIENKWTYNDIKLSNSTLSTFFEQKTIYISQPATYYYTFRTSLIKVVISANKISMIFPCTDAFKVYFETEVVNNNREMVFGGKTTIYRANITPNNMFKIEPTVFAFAFETPNYKKLEKSIRKSDFVDEILKFSSLPYCVNFDGEHGTGKTTFGSYIASSGIFDRIVVCNLVQAANLGFVEIVNSLDRQLTASAPKDVSISSEREHILLIMDEIDKWLESHILTMIHKMREEARGKAQTSDDKTKVIYEKMTEQEEADKTHHFKCEFYDQLYKFVEGNMLSTTRKYVIIFNTNHFDRMFEGADKRYDALKDRFTQYKFENMRKTDLIRYLKAFNEKLRTSADDRSFTPEKRENAKKVINKLCNYSDSIYDLIPDDIRISYRTTHKLLKRDHYSIEKTVHSLVNWVNETDVIPIASDSEADVFSQGSSSSAVWVETNWN